MCLWGILALSTKNCLFQLHCKNVMACVHKLFSDSCKQRKILIVILEYLSAFKIRTWKTKKGYRDSGLLLFRAFAVRIGKSLLVMMKDDIKEFCDFTSCYFCQSTLLSMYCINFHRFNRYFYSLFYVFYCWKIYRLFVVHNIVIRYFHYNLSSSFVLRFVVKRGRGPNKLFLVGNWTWNKLTVLNFYCVFNYKKPAMNVESIKIARTN